MVKPPRGSRVTGTRLYDERQGNVRLIVPGWALIGWERTSSLACLAGAQGRDFRRSATCASHQAWAASRVAKL